jgi:hypothetical protein
VKPESPCLSCFSTGFSFIEAKGQKQTTISVNKENPICDVCGGTGSLDVKKHVRTEIIENLESILRGFGWVTDRGREEKCQILNAGKYGFFLRIKVFWPERIRIEWVNAKFEECGAHETFRYAPASHTECGKIEDVIRWILKLNEDQEKITND